MSHYNTKDQPRCNHEINAAQVRLIDNNGEMVGVVKTIEAIRNAQAKGLDLVEISPGAEPPVCKLMDFGKYKYELQKKAHQNKKKQKVVEIKELKVRPSIAEGDYQIKLKSAMKFLQEGNKVRISLQFKGREVTHAEVGFAVMSKFEKDLGEIGKIETAAKLEGRNIFMIVIPQLQTK